MINQVETQIWKADDKRLQESEFGKLLRSRGKQIRTCHACGSVYDANQGGCKGCKDKP